MAAQEEGELFDLCSRDGAPLGVRKARALVHRDGDWHRSLHIWVVLEGEGGGPEVLFQRRSAGKDTWPRAVDVAVAGHYRAGESLESALREADEEIGLVLGVGDVTRIGLRRRADARAAGIRDNEVQDIFVARSSVALSALRPSVDEVEALVAVPVESAARMFRGEVAVVAGRMTSPGRCSPEVVEMRVEEFIPAEDGYYGEAMRSIEALLAGESPPVFTLPPPGSSDIESRKVRP